MKSKKKKKRNIIKILIIILIICLFIVIVNFLRLVITYQIRKADYKESYEIVGIKNGYIPQGMAYDNINNIILQTSYNHNHQVSRLYIIDFKTNKLLKELDIHKQDNSLNTTHVGGVATNGKSIWITSDYQISEFNTNDVLNTNKSYIKSIKDNKLPIRGDFCYYNEYLWIGDFCLSPFYKVPNNTPLLMQYKVEDEIDYNSPLTVASIPKMVQGMSILPNNNFVFTHSYTYLNKSILTTYKNVYRKTPDTYKLNGKSIPYYHFKTKDIVSLKKLPTMAEGIFYKDKELYILFESNSDSYKIAYPRIKKVIKISVQ